MKTLKGAVWALAIVASAAVAGAADMNWKPVQDVFGRKGEVDENVLLMKFDRTDLKVTKGGVPVSAGLVFDCWYGFWPMSDGTVMVMGDTCVREDEVAAVEEEMHRQELDITALHNHLIGETPKVMFLHMSAHGDAADLARKIKAVLVRTSTPMQETEEKVKKVDWSAISDVLGKPSETEGDIANYGYERGERLMMHGQPLPSTDALETSPEVKFQQLPDGRFVTYGEMILTAPEVAPVFHALIENGIEVEAVHNHMTDEQPRLLFMHWWGVGEPGKLAHGVKAALSKANVKPEAGK